ncbi:MAG: T9SS C-terminal target domain-containing protein, partial [Calditrichaeota bacterium]
GADVNRFFPALGNHDWKAAGAQPYLDYFTLPGNERYYDFVWGPVHFFCVDSDHHEPDGRTVNSTQAAWLQQAMTAASEPWKIVYMHHPPYSSAKTHGSTPDLQWPYAAWGATAVLAGHDHTYERIHRDGIVYFVNGVGGKSVRSFGSPVQGSQFRYSDDYGAMLVEANPDSIVFRFFNRSGQELDHYTVVRTPTGVGDPVPVAKAFRLEQNYPNPFNPATTIPFQLRQASEVTLEIYNARGQLVKTLFRGRLQPGQYRFRWDGTTAEGKRASSGIYLYQLKSGRQIQSRKMLFIQ